MRIVLGALLMHVVIHIRVADAARAILLAKAVTPLKDESPRLKPPITPNPLCITLQRQGQCSRKQN